MKDDVHPQLGKRSCGTKKESIEIETTEPRNRDISANLNIFQV